ncbi:MAG: hypothetical protein WCF84_21400 [Anaerolineae bacterium]
MKPEIRQILGKTIKAVVVSEENAAGPRTQVFLIFTDNTAYEFYGGDFSSAGGLDQGGIEAAVKYAAGSRGRITRYE